MSSIAEALVGTWSVAAFTVTVADAAPLNAFGADPQGYVSYGADGWMSVQVAASGREPFDVPDVGGGTADQTVADSRRFVAYAGPYRVDEVAGTVTHRLRVASVPNWVGDEHVRRVHRRPDGTVLLEAEPVETPQGPLVIGFRLVPIGVADGPAGGTLAATW